MSEFKLYMLLFSFTNIRSENMYCEYNGSIYKFFDKSLHESLFLLPVIILIALFCILKFFWLSVEFPQNIIPYNMVEWNAPDKNQNTKSYYRMELSVDNQFKLEK
jgi:hypothetical protein